MIRLVYPLVFFLLSSVTAAQTNLSDFLAFMRTLNGPSSPANSTRGFQMIEPYLKGDKSFEGEWETINEGLKDGSPFVRDQVCALLAVAVSISPKRPIQLPDITTELVIQRFGESGTNLRENAVRVITQMKGGVPASVVPKLFQIAQTDSASNVRSAAIVALATVQATAPEVTEFWVKSLNDGGNTALRGTILSTFRAYKQTDPRIIALVIDALKDTDYYVQQEAIQAVIKIGPPAAAALPLLKEIRDTKTAAFTGPAANAVNDEMRQAMRQNAESAIRLLSESPAK